MNRHWYNFLYFFQEGVGNMFSHGFMSFASIGITVACLLIMGTFTLVAVNADANLKEMERDNEILAFVDDNCTEEQARLLESRLRAIPNVTAVTYITKEDATQAFQEQYPEEDLFQDLDPAIFRDRYSIHIQDLKLISETKEAIKDVAGVGDVEAEEAIASGFITLRNIATVICVALIAILFIVSVFIVSNTIKLTTFDRREEIAIMRIVGATNSFISWPFVYEGFLMGLLSAAIAFFLQWGLYEAVAQGVSNNDTLQLIHIVEFRQLWIRVAEVFGAAGIVIGVGGSLSAIRKFLQV